MKFMTDAGLGRLAKWLRILGYDTVCYGGRADRAFLREAQGAGRIALTRYGDLANRQYAGRLVVITCDAVEGQIQETLAKTGLAPDPGLRFRLCTGCNAVLQDVAREGVADRVPDHVLKGHTRFRLCQACGRVFWPGTHVTRMAALLTERIRWDRP